MTDTPSGPATQSDHYVLAAYHGIRATGLLAEGSVALICTNDADDADVHYRVVVSADGRAAAPLALAVGAAFAAAARSFPSLPPLTVEGLHAGERAAWDGWRAVYVNPVVFPPMPPLRVV